FAAPSRAASHDVKRRPQRLASKNALGPASTSKARAEYSSLQGRLHESNVLGAFWYSGLSELRQVSTKNGSARRARAMRPEFAEKPFGVRQRDWSELKKLFAAGTMLWSRPRWRSASAAR